MHNTHNLPKLLIAIGLTLIASPKLHAAEEPDSQRLQKFKEFLSAPPIVKAIRFSSAKQDPTMDADGYVHFFGRYQSDGFFLCQRWRTNTSIPNYFTDEIKPYFTGWGNYRNQFWVFRNKTTQLWVDDGKSTKGLDIPVFMSTKVGRTLLAEVMTLGIKEAEIGALRWNGDLFSVRRILGGKDITGRLIRSGKIPTGLELDYSGFKYRIRYTYTQPLLLGYLPTTIEMYFVDNGIETKQSHLEITEVTLAPQALPPESFSVSQLGAREFHSPEPEVSTQPRNTNSITPEGPSLILYTNNERYSVSGSNFTKLTKPFDDSYLFHKRDNYLFAILIFVFVAALPACLWHFRTKMKH